MRRQYSSNCRQDAGDTGAHHDAILEEPLADAIAGTQVVRLEGARIDQVVSECLVADVHFVGQRLAFGGLCHVRRRGLVTHCVWRLGCHVTDPMWCREKEEEEEGRNQRIDDE